MPSDSTRLMSSDLVNLDLAAEVSQDGERALLSSFVVRELS